MIMLACKNYLVQLQLVQSVSPYFMFCAIQVVKVIAVGPLELIRVFVKSVLQLRSYEYVDDSNFTKKNIGKPRVSKGLISIQQGQCLIKQRSRTFCKLFLYVRSKIVKTNYQFVLPLYRSKVFTDLTTLQKRCKFDSFHL